MKKIIFYKLNGQVKSEEVLTKENLKHINGMMVKCSMINGIEEVGFADTNGKFDKEKYKDEYIFLWTWDNLDENTGELIGNNDEKFKQTFRPVRINEIEKIEAITYSNPRFGGKLTNKFEFHGNDRCEEEIEIPRFLIKKNTKENINKVVQDKEKLYYFLTVKYENYFSKKEYNYISDDLTVNVGDKVLVNMAGELVIAEVLKTKYYDEFNVPFPLDKTKKIIKKVDNNFKIDDIEYYDEWDDVQEGINTVKMNIEGTYFELGVFNYVSGKDNDEKWVNIKISVHNNNFKYFRISELMTSAEVENLLITIEKLLNDELNGKEKISFYEPDLEFLCYPKLNLWDTGEYVYIKEGHEIQDIFMELNINLTDKHGAYIGQKYVMDFDRREIEKIYWYIKRIVGTI